MLEESAQGDRRGADRHTQAGCIEAAGLPGEGCALTFQGTEHCGGLVARNRRLGPALLVQTGHEAIVPPVFLPKPEKCPKQLSRVVIEQLYYSWVALSGTMSQLRLGTKR